MARIIRAARTARIARAIHTAQPRAMGEPEVRRLQHLLDPGYAVEMPGRPDQFDLGIAFVYAGEGRQHGAFLFHGPGATRHDHRHGRGQA